MFMKEGFLNRPDRLGTVLLAIIGLADLLSTLALIRLGGSEGNPLFAYLLELGVAQFALAKLALLAGPLMLLEYARTKSPSSAEAGTWVAFGFYCLLWGGQIIRLGHLPA